MKTYSMTLILLLVLVVPVLPAPADTVTRDEAWTVAENWITLIINKEGSWGDAETGSVRVKEVLELMHGGRRLGYLCRVKPKGYVVISPCRQLTPVKAYSETGDLDPESDEGMAGLIKLDMERVLDKMEKPTSGEMSIQSQDVNDVTESVHRATWQMLACDVQDFAQGLEAGVTALAYESGTRLLSSNWNQKAPYNRFCPPGNGCENCLVGCVALAAAQIMRYWAWPPWGEGHHDDIYYDDDYDWPNMANSYSADTNEDRWMDENGQWSLTMTNVAAVAELCREIGKAAGMDYGCSLSTALCGDNPIGKDMRDAYQDHFRYNADVHFDWRVLESVSGWWDKIKDNINANRPLQYCISDPLHSMVCDGWRVAGTARLVHLKNWWKDLDEDTWYSINDLPGREGMIRDIYPAPSLGSWLSETDHPDKLVRYEVPSFYYRYFDQDCCGRNVTFDAGHQLQFLPGVKVYDTSPKGDYIRFAGSPSASACTRLFSIKGTATGGLVAGIRIYQGGIRLHPAGGLKFHQPPQAFGIAIHPTSGPVGTRLYTKVWGFDLGVACRVFFDSNGNWACDPGEPSETPETSSNGDAQPELIVPSVSGGTYDILADCPVGGPWEAAAMFVVTPTVTLKPVGGPIGLTVTIEGNGFPGHTSANVSLDTNHNGSCDPGEPTAALETDHNGTFSATLTVPLVPPGEYMVLADCPVGGSMEATATFTATAASATPTITLSPASGYTNKDIAITGSGFTQNTAGLVFFDSNRNDIYDSGEPSQSVTTNTNGTFATTLPAPAQLPGDYQVIADVPVGGSKEASATFKLTMFKR